MASSSSYFHRISFLFPLAVFLFSSLFVSDATVLKGVDPANPALNLSLTPCERIQVSGYSRTNLRKYAYAYRVKLAPLVTVPERLHSKIQVCVHRNASIGLCQCEKSDWTNLQKGIWSSVMSPYDKQYIDVKFSGESSGGVNISVTEDLQRWRIFCLVTGLAVFLAAPFVSSWLPFYYSSSMAVGIFLVVLIIVFQVMKLLPTGKKNFLYFAFYGSVVGAGSFILHQFSVFVNAILASFGLNEDMYNPVAILVFVGVVIIGAAFGFWTVKRFVVSEDGGVDTSVAQFVKWSMRSVACSLIFQSTLDTPFSIGALVSASLLTFLLNKWIHKKQTVVVQSHWRAAAAGRRHPLHEQTEYQSPPGGGLWSNARRPQPSYSGSPSYGVFSPYSANRRIRSREPDYYSTYHRTPNRNKMSKDEYEEVTRETTRKAMAGLAASPGFSDWLIEHSDRIQLRPAENSDDELGSEADSTGENSWFRFLW